MHFLCLGALIKPDMIANWLSETYQNMTLKYLCTQRIQMEIPGLIRVGKEGIFRLWLIYKKERSFIFFHGANADDLPQDIITKYFYKIEYKRIKKDSSFISVSPVAATKNIFTEKSFWSYEKREHPHPTMFNNNLVVSNTYIFDIKE